MPAMPLERVAARKGISAVVTKVGLERVHLRGFKVALEHVPRFQSSVEADLALGLLDRPCARSACVPGSNALYPCLELLRISKRPWSFSCC